MNTTRRKAGSRVHPVKTFLGSAFEDARSEVECLMEEIREWQESLESNNMEHLPKYEEVSACYNELESANDLFQSLEVPEALEELEISFTQDTRQEANSRRGRMGNADTALCAVQSAAEDWLSENEELELTPDEDLDQLPDGQEPVTQEMVDERQEQREKIEQFVSELEEAIGTAQNAEFPGMY